MASSPAWLSLRRCHERHKCFCRCCIRIWQRLAVALHLHLPILQADRFGVTRKLQNEFGGEGGTQSFYRNAFTQKQPGLSDDVESLVRMVTR